MAGTDELRRLEADLAADEALRARFDEAVREAAEAGAKSEAEAVAAAAAGLGYRVAVADLERSSAGAEEIDLDELAGVAGGWDGINDDDGFDCGGLFGWRPLCGGLAGYRPL